MADMSLADFLAVENAKTNDGFSGGIGWLILILLFFFIFGGDGFGFGNKNNSLAQVERDVLETSCTTQKTILDGNYQTLLGFKDTSMQIANCCCDIKNAIHNEGEETRALITQNEIQKLRDELQSAQLALNNTAQTQNILNSLRPFPQPAYITCSPYQSLYGCNNCCGNNLV